MSILVGDIGSWVYSRLKRPDVQDIANEAAGNFYLLLASAVPFEEFEITSAELPVLVTTTTIDLSGLSINAIMSVRLTNESTSRRLKRMNTRVYDAMNFSQTPGVPASYARWNKNIEVERLPSTSSMTVRLRYWELPVLQSIVADTEILIPSPWYELMRYETLYRVLIDLEEYEKAAMLVVPMPMPRQGSPHKSRVFEYGIIPKLWNDLLKTVKQRENADEDFSINPVVRRYTFS